MKTLLKNIGLIASVCLVFAEVHAQENIEKATKSFQVGDDVTIAVDAKYTKLIFETWSQDKVEIDAYIEGDPEDFGTNEEKQQILDQWNLKVMANSNKIEIISNGNGMNSPHLGGLGYMFDENGFGFMEEQMENIIAPLVEQITVMPPPQIPESLFENIGEIEFDYEAYTQNGEKYLKQFQKQMEQHFGKDFQESMQKWGEEFAKRMEERSSIREKRLEKLQLRLKDRHPETSGREERMQEWAERMKKRTERDSLARFSKKIITDEDGNKSVIMSFQDSEVWNYSKSMNRIIKIKMPKGADLNINVRHGDVNFKEDIINLNAELSHTPLKAAQIGGKNTKVQISYAPVEIADWEMGELSLRYVTNARIGKAKSIKLTSNSSDVSIEKLEKTGIISGTFGELRIKEVGNNFSTLVLNLKNSNLELQLPDTAFDFNYNGSHSEIKLPSSLHVESQESYGQKFINGYYKSKSNAARISINAQFSAIVLEK